MDASFVVFLLILTFMLFVIKRWIYNPAKAYLAERGFDLSPKRAVIIGFALIVFVIPGIFWAIEIGSVISVIALIVISGLLVWRFFPRDKNYNDEHRRGALLVDKSVVIKQIAKRKDVGEIEFGGVPYPASLEPYHLLLAGGTGSGKSVAIIGMLDAIRDRKQNNEKCIVVDSGGAFYSRYSNAVDSTLLNQFDSRSTDWSPFAEMRGPWDADALSLSIIPDAEGADGEWATYARNILSALLLRIYESGHATNERLFYFSCVATVEELRPLCAGLPAGAMMAEGNEKMFGSIRSILSSAIQPFSYLNQNAGSGSFSIRDFVENDKSGWLFLTYRDDMLASQKKIIATQIGIAARATLSQNPSAARRTWLVIDECASLGRIDSLDLFLTKARKCGGCAVIGLQSVSQLKQIYGRDGADVMLANLSSWLVLRVPDQATSEYMSRYLGDSEIKRTNESTSENGDSTSEQVTNTRVVMASTLQSLKTRAAYLNLAGEYPTCEIFLDLPPDVRQTAESFTQRDMRGLRTIPAAPALGVAADTSFIDSLLGNGSAIEDVESKPDPFKPKPGAFDI